MAPQALQRAAYEHLAPILNQSGNILYSSHETLVKGDIYFLGLNPGGDPSTHHDTVRDGVGQLTTTTTNAFIDESWVGNSPGQSLIQRRVKHLITGLGFETKQVCVSNLIFVRSRSESGCGYPENADICWPIHEMILEIVQPKLILICHGEGFRYVREKLGGGSSDSYPSGHGNWQCRSIQTLRGTTVVSLPHLSRYAIDRHPDVIRWVRSLMRR